MISGTYNLLEISQPPNWIGQVGYSALDIQTGLLTVFWASFALKIFLLIHLYTGKSTSYCPRRPILREGESHNFKTGWGRSISMSWTFKLDHWQPIELALLWKYCHLFTFILVNPILIAQGGQYWERGSLTTSKLDEAGRFQCLGHSNWTIGSLLS